MTIMIELKVQIPAGDAARVRDVLDADADMAVHMLAADVKMVTGDRKKGAGK